MRRSLAVTLIVLTVALTLGAIYKRLPHHRGATDFRLKIIPPKLFQADPDLGWRPPAGEYNAQKFFKGNLVYDVTYTIDSNGRRKTPLSPHGKFDRHLVMLGASWVFGEGVGPSQTLPAQLAERMPGTRAINFGFPGYGPQQNAVLMNSDHSLADIPERRGLALYLYIFDHALRGTGSLANVSYQKNFPCFEIGPDGRAFRNGVLSTCRSQRIRIFSWIESSFLYRWFPFEYPFEPSDDDYELTAAILENVRDGYQKHTEVTNPFAVVLLPQKDDLGPFKDALSKRKLKWIDLSGALAGNETFNDHRNYFEDGHPRPQVYEVIADVLRENLKNN